MSDTVKRTLVRRKGRGVIDPNLLYTTDACMTECKIGRTTLRELRQAGDVTPVELAHQLYYDGAELKAAVLKRKK